MASVQFIPTEEQTMLRDSARRWVEPRDPREAEDFAPTWAYFAEMGWLMAGLPEENGGLGGTTYDSAIIAEELGGGLIRAPFTEVGVVAARLLLEVAPQRVDEIAIGEARPVLAHEEPEARGLRSWVSTKALKNGDNWTLTGRKTAIIGAPNSTVILISAKLEDDSIALFEIARDEAPLKVFDTFDGRPAGELILDNTPATLVADNALAAIEKALDHGLVCESAEAVGAMSRALYMTRDYLLTRKQYGQLIGNFQALRHRLADMFIELEQARSIVLRGLAEVESDDPVVRERAAVATYARVAQAGMFVTANGIQLHGGIGVTDEHPVGHFYKRLSAFNNRHGTAPVMVERFAELSR